LHIEVLCELLDKLLAPPNETAALLDEQVGADRYASEAAST
jgi:hypothetical protein